MVFDLGRAMRKKEEFESARLMDFEFRRRARATRMLVQSLGLEEAVANELVATQSEEAATARLASLTQTPLDTVQDDYARCIRRAHAALVEERGDPTPYRMA